MASWGFRKSFAIAPGLRLNIGKKSASVRIGGRGFGFTAGTAGQRVSASVPGTGLSVTHKLNRRQRSREQAPQAEAFTPSRRPWGWLLLIYSIAIIIWWRVAAIYHLW